MGLVENRAEHLPVLTKLSSLVDILSLCNYCIMANVLDMLTYSFPDLSYGHMMTAKHKRLRVQYDYNAIGPDKRRYYTYIRGLAMNMINWIACHYDVFHRSLNLDSTMNAEPVEFVRDFAGRFLLKQAHSLLNYKTAAEEQNLRGLWNCTADDVRSQLNLLFDAKDNLYGPLKFNEPDLSEYRSFAFGDFSYNVIRKTTPLAFKGMYFICGQWFLPSSFLRRIRSEDHRNH